jgi:hypothetical protein
MIVAGMLLAAPLQAQYIYLDTNGDGVHTTSDLLASSGETVLDVWLRTDQNRDGTTAVCSSGENLTINSYEFILHAIGGEIAWGEYTNSQTSMTVSFGLASNITEYYTGFGGGIALPPRLHKLGSLSVEVVSGNPSIEFAEASSLSGNFLTSFGSMCPGASQDNTLRLGVDWTDSDGAGAAENFTFHMEVNGEGVGGPESVTLASCIPGSTQFCSFTAWPSRYPKASQGGCKVFTDSVKLFCTVWYTCNGQPAKGQPITAEVYPKQLTGGHCHADPTRPTAVPWTQSGVTDPVTGLWQFEVMVPEVAGVLNMVFYSNSPTCPFNAARDTSRTICVKVPNLVALRPHPSYEIWPGGADNVSRHPNFHYGTIETVEAVRLIAEEWRETYPGRPKLSINDLSLEWGGVFDAYIDPGFIRAPAGSYPNWISPHCGHRLGKNVDVRLGNQDPSKKKQIVEWFQGGPKKPGTARGRFKAELHGGNHFHFSLQ